MNTVTLFRALFILTLIVLPEAASAMYQRVASIACPDGKFVIEGRVDANIKFIGSLVRYRYRGIELTGINYEQYRPSLIEYLYADTKPERIHELNTPYRFNPTLYVPPGKFSKEEFERLADCLDKNRDAVSRAPGKTLLGLLYWVYPVTSSVMVNGITRLVYDHPPIRGLYYQYRDFLMLIERHGRVLLIPIPGSKLDENKPDRRETVLWGQVHPPRGPWRKSRLSLRPVIINGRIFDSEVAKDHFYRDSLSGRLLEDDYRILP